MNGLQNIQQRKDEHIQIVQTENVTHPASALFDDVHLIHQALPELSLDEIDPSVTIMGKTLSAPIIISAMTGGTPLSAEINRRLAEAAHRFQIAFGVGSQRVMLNDASTLTYFNVRQSFPHGLLLGNIGGQQLKNQSVDTIRYLMDSIGADGLCVHLNPAHELSQPEGDRDFRGILQALKRISTELSDRIIVKETGAGLSPHVIRRLVDIGIRYIDIAGAGGTSWPSVEYHRCLRSSNHAAATIAAAFSGWGIPTAACLLASQHVITGQTVLIASGGLKNGLDCAKAIALGAHLTGFAGSFIRTSSGAEWFPERFLETTIQELKTCMLLTSAPDLQSLRKVPRLITGRLRQWFSLAFSENGTESG